MIQTWLGSSGIAELFRRALSCISRLEESFIFKVIGKRKESSAWAGISWILLMTLVVGAVFIPRIPLGGFSRYYSLDLKIEDLALAGLILIFFVFRPADVLSPWRHAVESCFLCFLIAAAVSIIAGILAGTLDKPLMSLLCLVKWFEYFLIFFFSVRLSQATNPWRMIHLFFWMGLALAAYGYYEHFYPISNAAYPNYYRLYERAPFHGDANHIGGLLAMWLAFFSYGFLYSKSIVLQGGSISDKSDSVFVGAGLEPARRIVIHPGRVINPPLQKSATGSFVGFDDKVVKWILLAAILFIFFPFIWTFSRKSYFAFAGAYASLFFLPGVSRRRWIFLACFLILSGLMLPTRLAERLSDLGDVMTAVDPYHSSWAGNMDVWKRCFWNFDHFWLFGAGFGARHRLFYESQYIMTLTETGLLGFGTFVTLLLVPAFCAVRRLKTPGAQGVLAGAWLTAWTAFMIHNLSCVSLTVSKCAVVWWFLTGAFVGGMKKEQNA